MLHAPKPLNFDLEGPFLAIPGARIVTSYRNTTEGSVYSEGGSTNDFTVESSPVLYTAAGGGPYFDLDGTADYLWIADADWSEPLGACTMIIVYSPDSAQATNLCGVYPGGGQSKMRISIDASNNVSVAVTSDGSTAKTATQSSGYTHSTWNMAALVFSPAGTPYVRAWANGSGTTNSTAVNATLHNSTGALVIGDQAVALPDPFDGKVGLFAVYGTVIHDDHLTSLYAHIRQFYR